MITIALTLITFGVIIGAVCLASWADSKIEEITMYMYRCRCGFLTMSYHHQWLARVELWHHQLTCKIHQKGDVPVWQR